MSDQNQIPEDLKGPPISDELEQEIQEFERSLQLQRRDYVKIGLLVLVILATFFGLLWGAMQIVSSAEDAIHETVRQLFPAEAAAPAEKPAPAPANAPKAEPAKPAKPAKPTPSNSQVAPDVESLKVPEGVTAAAKRLRPLFVRYDNNRSGSGNLVLIAPNLAVTCHHVVTPSGSHRIKQLQTWCQLPSKPVAAKVLAKSARTDIALLRLDCPNVKPIAWAQRPPHGQAAWTTGFHYNYKNGQAQLWVRRGYINRQTSLAQEANTCLRADTSRSVKAFLRRLRRVGYQAPVAIGAPAYPGNSGSLVHGDAGELLGVLFFSGCRHQGYMVPAGNIRRFAKIRRISLGGVR
jgi:hypothetical protein